jgi:hypothetical protein
MGGFWWLNIESNTYYSGKEWKKPSPASGLFQLIDENEVSSMIWTLSDHTSPMLAQDDNKQFFEALQSARMNSSPFLRGYTTNSWETDGCKPINVKDTGVSAPMFADYLDALVCSGMPAWLVDLATLPQLYYPYPSDAPLCN